jgi:hypothetical protein
MNYGLLRRPVGLLAMTILYRLLGRQMIVGSAKATGDRVCVVLLSQQLHASRWKLEYRRFLGRCRNYCLDLIAKYFLM